MTDTGCHTADHDKSVPRARIKLGDRAIDGRGRIRSGPAILSYGFRPFFFGGALYAAMALPLWLWMILYGGASQGPFAGVAWHSHEMVFGYLGAVIAGFVLTAVPNWTGRLPLSGWPLALLFLSWLAGRLAMFWLGDPVWAFLLDMLFPTTLAAAVWREVIAGRNWRNVPIAVLLSLFAAANALQHASNLWPRLDGVGIRLALAVAAAMIALIGGRIVPSFTRNWLVKRGVDRLPASFGMLDRLSLATAGVGLAGWVALPSHAASGALLVIAGSLLAGRLLRWGGLRTWPEPMVLVLHLGYLWLSVSLLMLGGSALAPDAIPAGSAVHALTAGAIATMTLAVMTRASRGHTGRVLEADLATIAIYALVNVGALLRIVAPLWSDSYLALVTAGGLLWSLGFALFALSYGPMLFRPRMKPA